MNAVAKGRVLCIDDEPHILRALQWLLQKDFEVHTCEGAAEALRLLRRHDFDVVVSDQRMPGITGVELLRHVRRLAPRAMRILLTGYSDLDAMVQSVNESEVYRFITKPWDVRALPKLIAEATEVARSGPVAADAAEEAPGRDVTTVAMHPPAALLVIDDDQDLHTMVAAAVGPSFEVVHAYELASAVTLLDSRAVALIVSEVSVAGLDATRLLRMMKATHPEIVSLVATDRRDAETVMTLINQGQVYRILPKPLKAEFIKLLVEAALKRHRQIVEQPSMRRRFGVEATAQAVADSLYRDIMAAGMASDPPRHRAAPAPSAAGYPAPSPLHESTPALPPRAMALQAGGIAMRAGSANAQSPGALAGLKAGFLRLFGG